MLGKHCITYISAPKSAGHVQCWVTGGPLTRANYMACDIHMRLSQARLNLVGVNTLSTRKKFDIWNLEFRLHFLIKVIFISVEKNKFQRKCNYNA